MRGATHQAVDGARLLLLAMALLFCCAPTTQAMRCPTLGFESSRLNGRIGLFVGNNPISRVDPYGLAIGDWWDARTYFNSGFTGSWSDSANSIGQALGGALAGNWDQVASAYDFGIFGQTQDADPFTYYGTRAAVGTAAAATAVASAALASEGLASSGCYRVGASVSRRAASPFLRNAGSRWFSKMQTDALLQTGRLGNFDGAATWAGNLRNWLTTFRYAQPGGGEVVYNWLTRTIIHAEYFY